MPDHTLHAFADHGHVSRTLDRDAEDALPTLEEAEAVGIDLAHVTAELEREGVAAFCDSYRRLLECVQSKVGEVSVGSRW